MGSGLEGYPIEIEVFARSVSWGGAGHGASLMGTLKELRVKLALRGNAEGHSAYHTGKIRKLCVPGLWSIHPFARRNTSLAFQTSTQFPSRRRA